MTLVLDLAQAAAVSRRMQGPAGAAKRQLVSLGLVAVGVWGYNIGLVLTHLRK